MADESPPPPPARSGWPAWFPWAFAAGAAALLALMVFLPASITGDGNEYHFATVSLSRHGTPDLRPDDAAADGGGFFGGYVHSVRDRERYPVHFWAYPASAVPARLLLVAVGGNPLAALPVTNAAWFIAALAAVLFLSRRPRAERLAFALLAAVTPVAWYLTYTGPEVFSWALGVMALVALGNGRYAAGGLLVGLSATQNPPHLLFAVVPGVAALAERRWLAAVGCAAGGLVALAPVAFCLHHFGKPSLVADGAADIRLIGWSRTLSLLFDLNQGLLPYVPVLLAAVPLGVLAALRRRWMAAGVLAVLIGMLLAQEVQLNWNSDGCGLMRHLVWVLPAMAWLTAVGTGGRFRWAAVGVAVAAHGGVLAVFPPGPGDFVEQRPLARWVLADFPDWYSPDPAVFVERQIGEEIREPDYRIWEAWRSGPPPARKVVNLLPLPFVRADGTVTKLLLWRESEKELLARFEIDPTYLPTLLAALRAAEPPAYHTPPFGAVRWRDNALDLSAD